MDFIGQEWYLKTTVAAGVPSALVVEREEEGGTGGERGKKEVSV